MISKKLLRLLTVMLVIVGVLSFSGCNSLPGDGGTSTITGKVFVEKYNASGILFQSYYSGGEKVYIIYGDNIGYDDDVQTSYDGTYKFEYLRKGDYTIYAYSDCLTCDGSTEPKIIQASITDNNQVVELEDLIIENR